MSVRTVVAFGALLVMGATACASEEKPPPPPKRQAMASRNVGVQLIEYSVIPKPDTGKAGNVTFAVRNTGKEVHEFVVIKTNLSPFMLPTKKNGSVDEDKVNGIDEIEDIKPGTSHKLKVDLGPGKYALICNRVEKEEGKTDVHYKLGMRAAFSVR